MARNFQFPLLMVNNSSDIQYPHRKFKHTLYKALGLSVQVLKILKNS